MTESNFFREVLLEHARHPRNSGILKCPDVRSHVFNPLCGDELELTLSLYDSTIKECKTKVRGCSICQASASMMSEFILSKTLSEASITSKKFSESLKKESNEIPESLEFLAPLISLKSHRSRIKCMKLAWEALEDCASQIET